MMRYRTNINRVRRELASSYLDLGFYDWKRNTPSSLIVDCQSNGDFDLSGAGLLGHQELARNSFSFR